MFGTLIVSLKLMSNTKKHKKKAKEKKIRNLHALNAIQRKAGAEKNSKDKRKSNKKKHPDFEDVLSQEYGIEMLEELNLDEFEHD
jgi:hypothetical protein